MRKITYLFSLILVFVIPWEDSITISTLGSLARLIGLGVAGLWFWTILSEGHFRKFHLFHAFVLAFFVLNIISYLWSLNTAHTIERIKTYSQIFLLILILWELYQKPADLRAGLQAYIFGAFVAIASTISNYISGATAVAYETRYSATGINAVDLALLLSLGLPLAWHLFITADKKKNLILRLINLSYLPLAIFATFLTGSRTGLFAIIPAIIFVFWPKRANFGRLVQSFIVLVILLLVLWSLIPVGTISRLDTVVASISSADFGSRGFLWREAFTLFLAHPILGNGSGSVTVTIGSEAHNIFISILAETGLIGIILFLSIIAIVFNEIIKLPKGYSGLWLAVIFIMLIGTSLLSWEFRKVTWVLLSFAIIQGSFIPEQAQSQKVESGTSKAIIQRPYDSKNESEI
jgi:O-antigen ligase